MFLLERLFGVGTFAYFLAAACLLLAFTNVSRRGILAFYLVALSAMAFCFEPYVTADLHRINETMSLFSSFRFDSFWSTFGEGSSIPAARLLFWLVGNTGVYELLPLIATLVTYSCVFYILDKTAEVFSVSRTNVAIGLLTVMAAGTYFIVISNIRTVMALAMVCFCFFRESVEGKRSLLHIPIYLVAITLHNMAIVVFVLRLLAPLFVAKTGFLKRVARLLLVAALAMVAFRYFGGQIAEVMFKAEEYLSRDMYSYVWDYAIGFVSLLTQIELLCRTRRYRSADSPLSSFRALLALCSLVAVVFCFEFTIFHRFTTYIAPILAMPLFMCVFQEAEKGESSVSRFPYRTRILLVMVFMLLLACARGSLCGLKFFVL